MSTKPSGPPDPTGNPFPPKNPPPQPASATVPETEEDQTLDEYLKEQGKQE